ARELGTPTGAALDVAVVLELANHEDLARRGDLMPHGLQDPLDLGDVAERALQSVGGVDEGEVALLELHLVEHANPVVASAEGVSVEAVVRLRHAPALGTGAELALGALRAPGDEVVARWLAAARAVRGHVFVEDPHRRRIEQEVQLLDVGVVVVLEELEANLLPLGVEED